jgi:hypothetical protein
MISYKGIQLIKVNLEKKEGNVMYFIYKYIFIPIMMDYVIQVQQEIFPLVLIED